MSPRRQPFLCHTWRADPHRNLGALALSDHLSLGLPLAGERLKLASFPSRLLIQILAADLPVGHQQRKQSSDKTLKSPARGKFELKGSSAMSNLECEAQPAPQVTTSAMSMSPQLRQPSTQASGSSWHGKARAEKSRAGQLATQLLATRRNWYKEKLLKSLR